MSLITPLGPLSTLDLTSPATQQEILGYDKHQLLEGLVVEAVGERYISGMARHPLAELADVVLFRAKQKQAQSGAWFLWPRTTNAIALELASCLSKKFPREVVLCRYDPSSRDFLTAYPDNHEKKVQELLAKIRGIQKFTVDYFTKPQGNVQIPERMLEAFWGNLRSAYGGKLIDEVILPRLFKNFAVQPFFTWGWDVDRIFSYKSQLWQLELKHKYPFVGRNGLSFGINKGQVGLIKDLADSSINTLHLVMVKPVWSDQISPGYLHTRPELRKKVAFLAKVIDRAEANRLNSLKGSTSGGNTTFNGRGRLKYVPVNIKEFHQIGTYEDDVDAVLERILSLLDGGYSSPASDSLLQSLRLTNI